MNSDRERPADLTVNRPAQRLEIVWGDGHQSHYPLSGLRNVCPCADCRGGHENMGGPVDRAALHQVSDKTWEIKRADLVGNYALNLTWADGHNGGIYSWSFLRELCPCDQCEAEARQAAEEAGTLE
ncbi:MAG: DUF971 domain-containing protein [Chloroflexota bacterium]|nr:DUF971 domain-containing protein [Chloroflexota bacterium]